MSVDFLIGGMLAMGLIAYLLYALLYPQRF